MTNLKRFTLPLLILALACSAFGQTTITSTTLSAAVTDKSATFLTVASATGFVATTASNSSSIFVDGEYMLVLSVSGTRIGVLRGAGGTAATTHKNAAVVYVGPPNAFAEYDPKGQCTRSTLLYVPIIVPSTGRIFDCLGVTTAGQYAQTNAPGIPVVGTTVASATSITPTGTHFVVSGTTAVATIVVPAGFAPGMSITIRPTGIFATTTAGNIGLITSATVVGRVLTMTWDGSKFWPSYVN